MKHTFLFFFKVSLDHGCLHSDVIKVHTKEKSSQRGCIHWDFEKINHTLLVRLLCQHFRYDEKFSNGSYCSIVDSIISIFQVG